MGCRNDSVFRDFACCRIVKLKVSIDSFPDILRVSFLQAYQAASLSYERKISFRNLDDDYEGPRRFEFLSQLVKSFRLYWRSFRRLRLVSI